MRRQQATERDPFPLDFYPMRCPFVATPTSFPQSVYAHPPEKIGCVRPSMSPSIQYAAGFTPIHTSFNFLFFSVSSGLIEIPSTHRRNCDTVTQCVVAGSRTSICI